MPAPLPVARGSSRDRPIRRARSPAGRGGGSSSGAHAPLRRGLRCHQQRLVRARAGARHDIDAGAGDDLPSLAQAALAAGAQEGLDVHEVARVGLDDGGEDVAGEGDELDGEVGGGPGEQQQQQARWEPPVADAAGGADEAEGVEERDDVADDGEEPPEGDGAELEVGPAEAAAAVAVDEPLVPVGLAPEGGEDAGVVRGEAGGQGPLGLPAAAGGGDVDVVFWVLRR